MNSIQVDVPGIKFQSEDLADDLQRFSIEARKGSVNVEQLNAVLSFLQGTDLPNTLLCLHQMYFQSTSDKFFSLTDEERASLEAMSGMLIKCWIAERKNNIS